MKHAPIIITAAAQPRSASAIVHQWAARLKAARSGIVAAALLLFCGGIAWSVSQLAIDWSDLRWLDLALAFALLTPALWLNALELQLCARATSNSLTLSQALAYSCSATLANLLPLPGGALVRGAALMKAGASLRDTGGIVFAAALLWLALAAAISALAISRSPAGIALAAAGLIGAAATLIWVWRRSGAGIACGFLAVRLMLLGLMIGRLSYCFGAIGAEVSLGDAAAYTVASVLGSAAGIVPAGLGVAEAIGAMLATLASASPAEAFLSLGLNRVIGLIGTALVVLCLIPRPSSPASKAVG
jgi:hypothetical protein